MSRKDTDHLAQDCLLHALSCKDVFDIFVQNNSPNLEAVCALQVSNLLSRSSNSSSGSNPTPYTPYLLHVLPLGISPPASYLRMVDTLLTLNEDEPYGFWQDRTHTFLANASLETLSNFNEATVQFCVQRWATLMRSQNCVESLYAAYVASRLQRHAPNISSTDSSFGTARVICPTLRVWIEKCNSMFQGANAIETTKNTLARILKLTCDDKCRTLANADDAIVLARNALNVAMIDYESDWNKDTGPYTRKLSQKFSSMPLDLQMATLHILALSDIRQLFADVPQVLQGMLRHLATRDRAVSSGIDVLLRIINRCIDSGLILQTPNAFDVFFQELVAYIFEQCKPQRPATPKNLFSTYHALDVIKILQQEDSASGVARSFLHAAGSMGLPEWWPLNMSTPGSPENCSGLQTCVHADESSRQELCDKVCLLLLTSAASSGYQLPEDVITLVKKRLPWSSKADPKAVCCYRPFVAQQHLVLPPQQTASLNENWREHLNNSLTASAAQTNVLLQETIMAVTQDLQDRCENVERPLNDARRESEQLRDRIQLVQNKLASAVAENESLQEALQTERHERGQMSAVSDDMREASNRLQEELARAQARVKDLENELTDTVTRHRESLENAQKQAVVELDLIKDQHTTRITELEALLSSQAQAATALESETAWLKEQMEAARQEMEAEHQRKLDEIRHRFDDEEAQLQEQIDILRSDVTSRDDRLERLNRDLRSKDRSLSEMERDARVATETVAQLESKLRAERTKLEDMAKELSTSKDTNDKLVAELGERDNELEEQADRLTETETAATQWQQRCIATEKALAEARAREDGIQKLLRGDVSNGVSEKPVTKGRRATSQVLTRQSTQHLATPAAAPRLPAGSFLSQDDSSDNLEVTKYGQ